MRLVIVSDLHGNLAALEAVAAAPPPRGGRGGQPGRQPVRPAVAAADRAIADQLPVNPGSVGQPAYADDHPYPHAIESGSPDAREAIVERRQQQWQAQLITVPYDHHRMAALARALKQSAPNLKFLHQRKPRVRGRG